MSFFTLKQKGLILLMINYRVDKEKMSKSLINQNKNKKKREMRKKSFKSSDSESSEAKQIKIDE